MQSINRTCIYINASSVYINESSIYTNATSVYNLFLVKNNFSISGKEVRSYRIESLLLMKWMFTINKELKVIRHP
ncbi:hypothetical protein KGMB02408_33500 [Bacteroides faecalis]|uniref:Uncharacterized protein n=1 Tax=Bacteroides faecalis TaxID=2447885 RepID=A0A401LY16_9BACE|nr:hypothetical protein KGMB02408_33500 [Bacteroides faecalis]